MAVEWEIIDDTVEHGCSFEPDRLVDGPLRTLDDLAGLLLNCKAVVLEKHPLKPGVVMGKATNAGIRYEPVRPGNF